MLASVSSDVVAAGKMRLVKLPNVVNIYGDDVGYGDVGVKSPEPPRTNPGPSWTTNPWPPSSLG